MFGTFFSVSRSILFFGVSNLISSNNLQINLWNPFVFAVPRSVEDTRRPSARLCVAFFFCSLLRSYFVYIRTLRWQAYVFCCCFVSFLSNLILFRSTCTLVTYHLFKCEEAFVDNGNPWLPSKRCDSVWCHTRPSADWPCNSMEYTKYDNTSYERLKRISFGWDHCWMQLCIQGRRVFLFFRIKSTWPHAVSHYWPMHSFSWPRILINSNRKMHKDTIQSVNIEILSNRISESRLTK